MAKRHKKAAQKARPNASAPAKAASMKPEPGLAAAVVRAFIIGFLIAAGLVRIVPGDASFAFIISGAAVGLLCTGLLSSVVTSTVSAIGVLLVMSSGIGIGQAPPVAGATVLVAILVAATGAVIGFGLRTMGLRKVSAYGIAALIVLLFLVQGLSVARAVSPNYAAEPPNEGYAFDPIFFMKVFYLQDSGMDFYRAYGEGFVADSRFAAPMPDIAGWRSPTITTLWSLLFSSGAQIVYAFLLLGLGALVAVYVLGRHVSDEVSALVAPALLAPYYLVALQTRWFPEYEFWAGFAVLGSAVMFTVGKRWRWPALGVAVLGGAMREWLISGTLAGAVETLGHRKWKEGAAWVLGALAVAAVYIANSIMVRRYLESVGVTPGLGAGGRLGDGGPLFILYTLRFCADLFAQPYIVAYLVLALGLFGVVARALEGDYFVAALLVLPLCAFMIFGSGRVPGDDVGSNDYYNAAFMPFAMIMASAAPSLLTRWLPGERR